MEKEGQYLMTDGAELAPHPKPIANAIEYQSLDRNGQPSITEYIINSSTTGELTRKISSSISTNDGYSFFTINGCIYFAWYSI